MKKRLIFFLMLVAAASMAQSNRPNIILIVTDDLEYGDIDAFGATDTLLFNLKADIGERSNLIKSNPVKAKELLKAWIAYGNKIGTTPTRLVQRMPADDSHIQKRLKRQAQIKSSTN